MFDSEEEAAAEVARELARAAEAGAEIALTGGTSPRYAYERAASASWESAGVWWGDDRCVPPDHELSNYRMAKEALLDRLATPPRAVHRIRGELDPREAADLYDAEIRDTPLDLVLLGLGPDGHIASLFPGRPELRESGRAAIATEAGMKPLVPRVSLTLAKLCEAPLVLFFVAGRDKAEAVERALGGEPSEETPGSLARSRDGRTVAVLDRAAAARLPS